MGKLIDIKSKMRVGDVWILAQALGCSEDYVRFTIAGRRNNPVFKNQLVKTAQDWFESRDSFIRKKRSEKDDSGKRSKALL